MSEPTTTKGLRAPDPDVEATKLRRAEHYVRKVLGIESAEMSEEAIMDAARKVAKITPPFAFRGRYMS